MKKIRKLSYMVGCALGLGVLAACSSPAGQSDELAKAQQEVQNIYPEANIPKIDGLELTLAYQGEAFSLPDVLKSSESDSTDQKKDSIVLVYSREKGELQEAVSEDSMAFEKVLYGPYEGDGVVLLTLSDLPSTIQGADKTSIDGTDIELAHPGNDLFYATARPDDVTYTLQATPNSGYEEEKLLEILAQASHSEGK
ncbi:hypothetical protein [Saccharibacillus sp. JS10]|uniref:hypothetical protein n=1 Tax=Saccharibacillus sp. JS10 TaxID=2950552 RepID=UPI002108A1D4|nr:hypothetical protein [Saccharibacillus sp. JS10]MCQ4086246.1 hypothetical protein [Saccharibacillus sp. JS10]